MRQALSKDIADRLKAEASVSIRRWLRYVAVDVRKGTPSLSNRERDERPYEVLLIIVNISVAESLTKLFVYDYGGWVVCCSIFHCCILLLVHLI